MAEVSAELVYELLKAVQARLAQIDGKLDEHNATMLAMKYQITGIHHNLTGIHSELSGIHATLIRHDHRLDRIEHRLDLSDAPTLA